MSAIVVAGTRAIAVPSQFDIESTGVAVGPTGSYCSTAAVSC